MNSNSRLSIAMALFVIGTVLLGACAPSGGQQGQTAAPATWPTSQMLTAIASGGTAAE